jgi:hypothetical protein
MEGPTSSGGSRNRLTCLNLQEHDDDDISHLLQTITSALYLGNRSVEDNININIHH